MNSKDFLTCLIIFALLASFTQGLTIRTKHDRQIFKHKAKQFSSKIQTHLFEMFHAQNDDSSNDPFLVGLMQFAMNDEEISNSIQTGTPISEEAASRLKDYMKNSQHFNGKVLQTFQDPKTPDCLKELSDDQKSKFVGIFIDNMDMQSFVTGNPEGSGPDDATVNNIIAAIQSDEDLGDDVATCYQENADVIGKVI